MIIGAAEYKLDMIEECYCDFYDDQGKFYFTQNYGDCLDRDECLEKSRYRFDQCDCKQTLNSYYHEIEPSDGVVTKSSQWAFPGVQWKDRLEGSNHQQCRNDRNAGKALYALLDPKYHPFFGTPKR